MQQLLKEEDEDEEEEEVVLELQVEEQWQGRMKVVMLHPITHVISKR